MEPEALEQLLSLKFPSNAYTIANANDKDDAGAIKIGDKILLSSVDVITPVCKDPKLFGKISLSNALSDIYAMGGTPLAILSILFLPSTSNYLDIGKKILEGINEKAKSIDVANLGGHVISDRTVKVGISVMGLTHKDKLATKNGASLDDLLLITKPIGTGASISAVAKGKISEDEANEIYRSMEQLNHKAAKIFQQHGIHTLTDVTGFGLLIHCWDLVKRESLGVEIYLDKIPYFKVFQKAVEQGIEPAATERNYRYIKKIVKNFPTIEGFKKALLFDPQTSGGLIAAIPPHKVQLIYDHLKNAGLKAAIIGKVIDDQCIKII